MVYAATAVTAAAQLAGSGIRQVARDLAQAFALSYPWLTLGQCHRFLEGVAHLFQVQE
jgi:hypothetical protein